MRQEAAADLRHALEIARRQKAPSLQLRAARDLARLLVEQGDGQHAIELLAPIYGRFAEGFDTPDLVRSSRTLALGLSEAESQGYGPSTSALSRRDPLDQRL
jgi:predicted ATPase